MEMHKKRGSLAISQIIILIIGIVAIAYAAGSQIGGVSATNAVGTNTGSSPSNYKPTISGKLSTVASDASFLKFVYTNTPKAPAATASPFMQFIKGVGVNLAEIATYAGIALGAYSILNWAINQLGVDKNSSGAAWLGLGSAAVSGAAGGAAAWGMSQLLGGGIASTLGLGLSLGIGAVIAVIIFLFTYHQHTEKATVFTCIPWQAPLGSTNCNKCGQDGLPCTAYQCASLGQNCEFLNSGVSGKQICTTVNKDDTVPPVMGFIDMEPNVYSYQPLGASGPSENNSGVVVSYTENGSSGNFPPYTDFPFGISTNEPARCGISPEIIPIIGNQTGNDTFSQLIPMDAGIFEYNHSFDFNTGNATALPLINGKMNFYVRCQDANGNKDMSYFVVQFGVNKTIVHTLPIIKTSDLLNNSPVTSGITSTGITIYVNKPVVGCKWSPTDRTYQNMENTMDCSQGKNMITNGPYAGDYPCTTTLNGIISNQSSSSNNFYFRCNDTLGDVNNAESVFMIHLIGTQPLVIQSSSPNNTVIEGTSNSIPVTLNVQTFAGASGNGSAICYYNNTVGDNNYIPFGNTGGYQSTQQLSLPGGNQTPIYYTFPIRCTDVANNPAYATIKFGVLTDTIPPIIVRLYKDGSNLAVVTDKNSTCVYGTVQTGCTYLFKDGIPMTDMGTLHETKWVSGMTYYIKCQDSLGIGPEPSNVCTLTVQASPL